MENPKKKCSSSEHGEIEAICFCRKCEVYMCKKCETFHSKLCQNHQIYFLEKNNGELFTGYCEEKEHQMKLEFFCKTHNQLCCAACIAKIKKQEIGKHKDCDVCIIEDIKEEKRNKLNKNIRLLEELSNTFEESIKNLKEVFEKINNKKEQLKMNIQNIFTNIRNELNNREDQLLLNVDKHFEIIFFNEDIIKRSEKLPNKIKLSLEKSKIINEEDNKKKINLSSLINDCINIENNIKEINFINKNIKQCYNSFNFEIKFNPEDKEINNFLDYIINLEIYFVLI